MRIEIKNRLQKGTSAMINDYRTTRRNFLKTTTAVAATAVLASSSLLAQDAAPTKKLGYCCVGVGSLTMNQILPGLMKAKYCKPIALVSGHDGNLNKAYGQADKFGIDHKNVYNYADYDSIKNNPDIDVVYVVLPNGMHKEYTIRAAQAGKHVLCEKPMANNAQEAQDMIDGCKAAGKLLQIGYRMHFEPTTLAAIAAIKRGDIGKLQMIEAAQGFRIGTNQWRLDKKLAGGGCLMDIGIYGLQGARYLSGEEPTEVFASTYADPNDPDGRFKEVEQSCNWQMKFPSGAMASCLSSYNGQGLGRFTAFGERGYLVMDPSSPYNGTKMTLNSGRGRSTTASQPSDFDEFAAEMDGFAQLIASKGPALAPGEEGLRDMKIIDAIYKSAATGQAVKLS
jgi:glucose-fructose oxidoreductase